MVSEYRILNMGLLKINDVCMYECWFRLLQMKEWWWGKFVKKNTGLGWIEIDWYEYMDLRNLWN